MMSSDSTGSSRPATLGSCLSCGVGLSPGDRRCPSCGTQVFSAFEEQLLDDLRAATLGEYEIIGLLGRGGMGMVFLGHDIMLNRKVAIKALHPALTLDTTNIQRFRREAQVAASLRHRNITSIFGLKEPGRLFFFIMEYIEGRTLESILRAEAPLDLPVAQAVLQDVAGALAYAHRHGITHRDIKPANVIIDTEGTAVVTDFGVAKVRGVEGLTTTGAAIGTPLYMSPEQWSGQATHLSDQYALGCVAYHMLTGHPPFKADTLEVLMRQQVFERAKSLVEVRPDCDPAMARAVMRMLEKQPAARWPSLGVMKADLETSLAGPGEPTRLRLAEQAKQREGLQTLPVTPHSPVPSVRTTVPSQPRGQRSRRRLRGMVVVTALAIMGGLAVGTYSYLQRGAGSEMSESTQPGKLDESRVELGAGQRAESQAAPSSTVPDAGAADGPGQSDIAVAQPIQTPDADATPGVPGANEADARVEVGRSKPRPTQPKPTSRPESEEPGRLRILILGAWAHVFIDDDSLGRVSAGGGEFTLAAGSHRVVFSRAGFQPIDTTVTLRPGELTVLNIQLREKEP